MTDFAKLDPVLQRAVTDYEFTSNAPMIADAIRTQIANLAAANSALRELIGAAEQCGGSVVFPSQLTRRHGELLSKHQQTWNNAFCDSLPCQEGEAALEIFGSMWDAVFLRIIIDWCEESATVVQFDDRTWVRIFGNSRSSIDPTQRILLTDKHVSLSYRVAAKGLSEVPIEMVASMGDHALRYEASRKLGCLNQGVGTRSIYSYGPIGDCDQDVRLEAMRNVAAAVDCAVGHMNRSANAFSDKTFMTMSHVYRQLDDHGIPTPVFHAALSRFRAVERHAIEVARIRNRGKGPGATVNPAIGRATAAPKKRGSGHRKGR